MIREKNNINWAILTTGWGRSAANLMVDFKNNKLPNSSIKLLVHANNKCKAAITAKELGINSICIKKTDFKDTIAYQKKILKTLQEYSIDYIFLLAYGYIIKEPLLSAYSNKIVNIHPSLLPSFAKTEKAIQKALKYGVKITGITTHFIDENLDEGVIICQTPIKIKENDTFDSLDKKFQKKGRKIVIKTIKHIEKNHLKT